MQTPPRTLDRAGRFRRETTLPEVLPWQALGRRKLNGWRFRRRHPIGPCVLDLCCDEAKRAMEEDGHVHGWRTGRAASGGTPSISAQPAAPPVPQGEAFA